MLFLSAAFLRRIPRSVRSYIILTLKYIIVNTLIIIIKVKFVKSKQKIIIKIGTVIELLEFKFFHIIKLVLYNALLKILVAIFVGLWYNNDVNDILG